MKFFEAVKSVFCKYATFTGRARRSEFWYFYLFNVVVGSILAALGESFGFFALLSRIYAIATLIPGLAVAWRRYHDIGKSGINILLILIPLAGLIIYLVQMARPGIAGANQYGPDPKGETAFGKDDGPTPPWEY